MRKATNHTSQTALVSRMIAGVFLRRLSTDNEAATGKPRCNCLTIEIKSVITSPSLVDTVLFTLQLPLI